MDVVCCSSEFSKSLEQFQMVQASDPYLLANMDILSHILFVKVRKVNYLYESVHT